MTSFQRELMGWQEAWQSSLVHLEKCAAASPHILLVLEAGDETETRRAYTFKACLPTNSHIHTFASKASRFPSKAPPA